MTISNTPARVLRLKLGKLAPIRAVRHRETTLGRATDDRAPPPCATACWAGRRREPWSRPASLIPAGVSQSSGAN